MRGAGTLAVILASVSVLWGASAGASGVRVNSLGGGERQITLDDEVGARLLPSVLVEHPNLAFIDVMEPGVPNASFGGHFALSEVDVLAVWGGAQTRPVAGGLLRPGFGALSGVDYTGAGAVAGLGGEQPASSGTVEEGGGGVPASQPAMSAALTATSDGAASLGGLGSLSGALPLLPTLMRAELQGGLAWAHRFDGWRLGVAVSAWADLDQQTDPEEDAYELRTSFYEVRVGAGFDLGHRSVLDFAVVGGVAHFTDAVFSSSADEVRDRWGADGLWQVGLVGRARLSLSGDNELVPYAEFLYRGEDMFVSFDPVAASVGEVGSGASGGSLLALEGDGSFRGVRGAVGVDVALKPFDGVLVQPGIGFQVEHGQVEWDDMDASGESLVLVLPTYGVAVEAWALDWLAVRFHARQRVRMHDDTHRVDGQKTHTKRWAVDTDVAFGLGFRFAGFHIDALLDPELFTTGPYGVSGEEGTNLSAQLSVKYAW